MITLPSHYTSFFDVDDTLVMWTKPHPGEHLEFNNYGHKVFLLPNQKHIAFLKAQKARGFTVVVWSQGGAEWAEEVVKVLGLEAYVDLVITKPTVYVDDLLASEFMTNRVYFTDKKKEPEPGNANDEDFDEYGERK